MKKLRLKTKRLVIEPMENEEIENLIQNTEDDHLKKAYMEMLASCNNDPEHRIWYAPWKMCLKKDNTYIGDLGFKGPVDNYSVEIGYGVLKEYEENGYTTEAVKAVVDWAYTNKDVYFVEAEVEEQNEKSKRVLEKLEFTVHGEGKEGWLYVKEAPKTSWASIYMCFGAAIGTSLGQSNNNMSMGMCLGIVFGFCIGMSLDAAEKKKREDIYKHRKENKEKKEQ